MERWRDGEVENEEPCRAGSRPVDPAAFAASFARFAANLHGGACVDEFMQDQVSAAPPSMNTIVSQLIIYMVLARGRSRLRCAPTTMHTQTALHVGTLLAEVQ